jgi:hypothetical protein
MKKALVYDHLEPKPCFSENYQHSYDCTDPKNSPKYEFIKHTKRMCKPTDGIQRFGVRKEGSGV